MNLFSRILVLSFAIGLILGVLITSQFANIPSNVEIPFTASSPDLMSPYDHIKESQIHVYDTRVVIDLSAEWARLEDTRSMEPLLDKDTNVIQIIPQSENDIHVGDVISYETEMGTIIHRVIEIGQDDKGTYYIAKGDNNEKADPYKIRFSQVVRILVGVLY